jgi:hypothetical protein
MTRSEAHALLSVARVGGAITRTQICEALHVTGDLESHEVVRQYVRPAGTWERAAISSRSCGPFDGLLRVEERRAA